MAWLLMQIATQIFPFFEIPNWAIRLVVLLLVLGFPVALVLAWAFELTPEGIKRESDVPPNESITAHKGRKLLAFTVVVALIAAGLFAFRFLHLKPSPVTAGPESPVAVPAPVSLQFPAKSIAVLPFENLSSDKENAYFADGIQDEILARLSKIAELKVISRTSTQKYKSAPANLREIAQELGVANILEGSVQKAADTVRITVQLINARNDQHLWSDTYDRKLIDVFQVESDVAQKIAGVLAAKLTGREKAA
ncbi:MAG: adenylyl cyclase, partial [Verrucomicrobiota bacterium]|nr:adenylyl cyclase [Verrucomicrobiota bacterium]